MSDKAFHLGSLIILPDHIKYVDFEERNQGTIDICLGEPYNTTVFVERVSKEGKAFMIWLYPIMEEGPVE